MTINVQGRTINIRVKCDYDDNSIATLVFLKELAVFTYYAIKHLREMNDKIMEYEATQLLNALHETIDYVGDFKL